MELSAAEIRVLGSLVEKERTTPDQYPLTTNALRSACNQKSNRDPVVSLSATEIDQTMLSLRTEKLARTVQGAGSRTPKHRHILDEAWGLDDGELAVMTVLMLRGPQTPGELKGRTERLHAFADLDEVGATLRRLASRDDPFVAEQGRMPGQKETRWAHLLGDEELPAAPVAPRQAAPEPAPVSRPAPHPTIVEEPEYVAPPDEDRILELEEEVQSLRSDLEQMRQQFDNLCEQLGVEP
ncbi:MAG: YceH family protein [Actinomycetota bacterium]|nr:YceH family protein [Actinomycetota bacterium]